MVDVLVLVVGIIIGVVLGLTGAGGSVFAVPLLIHVLGFSVSEAVGLSLGAVAASAIFGSFMKWRAGDIQWLPALIFIILGSLASPMGSWLNRQGSGSIILMGFCLLMSVVAFRMWRQATLDPDSTTVLRANTKPGRDRDKVIQGNESPSFEMDWSCAIKMGLSAVCTGILSGLFGVGGGFLIVPALLSLTRMSVRQAVSTSLVVIAAVGSVGFLNFIWVVGEVNSGVLLLLILGGVVGMVIGVFASRYLAGPLLQKIFAVLMVVVLLVTILSCL